MLTNYIQIKKKRETEKERAREKERETILPNVILHAGALKTEIENV